MEDIKKAISHFDYGVKCDIFQEPVTSYAKMAISALEKQIPNKPKIYNNIYPKDLYECPLCECGLRANASWKDDYCPKCGVKIDWSDIE